MLEDGAGCKVGNCLACTGWTLAELKGQYFRNHDDHERLLFDGGR